MVPISLPASAAVFKLQAFYGRRCVADRLRLVQRWEHLSTTFSFILLNVRLGQGFVRESQVALP